MRTPSQPASGRWRPGLKSAIHAIGMVPAAWTFYLGFADRLGADPLKILERTLGLWSLRFLVLGLAITPLRRLGGPNLIKYRRAIGLLAFFYALLHVSTYVLLDQSLDFAAIWRDIVKRPYITVGMLALSILVPLAVTSNNAMIKRMGGAAWQRLHRLVYLACIAAALHFTMLIKSWAPEPVFYALAIAALLLFRLAHAYITPPQRMRRAAAAGFATTPVSRTPPGR